MSRRAHLAAFAFSLATTLGLARAAHAEEPTVAGGADGTSSDAGGMSSPALFGTGIVMSGAGVAGLATGAYLFTQGAGSCDGITRASMPSDAQIEGCMGGVGQQIGGVIAMVTGGALLLGGIPVLAVGASSADGAAPAATQAVITVSPGGAALSVRF